MTSARGGGSVAGSITLAELVRNGTMSAEVGAALWSAVEKRRSFVNVAIPRLAGKTTVMEAMLSLLPKGVPVHRVVGEEKQMAHLKEDFTGGYLVVGEFSQAPVPGYIWGEPVCRVFDTLSAGYSLATALHAPGPIEAMGEICRGNGVSDEDASFIDLIVYIRRFGETGETFWRRIAEVYEVDKVEKGRPVGRTLYRWCEVGDRFEQVAQPRSLGSSEELEARARVLVELVQSGKTAPPDMVKAVEAWRASRPR